jgi:Domain of unknown function (DUF4406)
VSVLPAPPEFSVCYISGPITGVPDFRDRFNAAAMVLRQEGWIAINPASKSPPDSMLSEAWGENPGDHRHTRQYAQLMRISFHEVLMSHVVFVLPGWKVSTGACNEVHLARTVATPVRVYNDEPYERHLLDIYSVATVSRARRPDGVNVITA